MKIKSKILFYILEVIAILVAIIYLAITKVIPEYQASLGSSERLFKSKNYATGVEVKISTGPTFFLIINKNNQLTNIFIENELAGVIANQDIEGKNINKAIPEIFQKLIDANLIDNKIINIINYNEQGVYQKVISLVRESLQKNKKTLEIIESSSTLQKKAKELNLEEKEDTKILWMMYLNSVDMINKLPKTTNSFQMNINEETATTYANTIYQKLNTYMINVNVKDQEINDLTMPIQNIPGDSENTVYASSDSWYYIKDYRVYAEITITGNQSYTFCYMGSSENKKEGKCS